MNNQNTLQDSPDSLRDVQQQMRALGERVERIEMKLQIAPQPKAPFAAPEPQVVPEVPRPPVVVASPRPVSSFGTAPSPPQPKTPPAAPPPPPVAAPISTAYIPGADEPDLSHETSSFSLGDWENLIGGKWSLWIGSLCLFLAMASFLAYTWAALPPAPPWARVTMGMLSGLAMMGAGGFLRPRTKRYFNEGLSGAGLSICYLSLWAGSQYFAVLSPVQSFVGMALLTGLGVMLALRYDALSLSALSTLGGFLTPALVGSHGSGGSSVPFLTYVALVNAGILGVSLGKRWRGLVWLSFACTIMLVGGWWLNSHFEAVRVPLFLFATLTFAQYMAAATFYSLIRREETASEDLLLLFASASLYALVGYNLAEPFIVGFPAAFPLALAAFFGLLNLAITRIAPANASLRYSSGGLALLAVTVAVPLQLRHAALTIGWIAEAAVLLFLSGKLKSALLRRAGQMVWLLTGVPLFQECAQPFSSGSGLLSSSALPLAVCVGVSTLLSWNARRSDEEESDGLEPAYAIAAVVGGGWLLAQEIYRTFELHHSSLLAQWTGSAYLVIATVLAVYSLGVFILGIKCRHEVVRCYALIGSAVIACMGLFSIYAAANEPTAVKVALHWPASLIAFGVIGLVLAAIAALLHREEAPLEHTEKEVAHAWLCGTILFLLAGSSLHLYSTFSIYRAAFGTQWTQIAVYGLSMFWCLAASLLLSLGCRWRDEWMRCLALLIGGGALAALVSTALTASLPGLPIFNWRVACFAAAIVGLQFSAATLRRNPDRVSSWKSELPSTLNYLSLSLLLWVLTQESYETSRYYQDLLGTYWQRQAQMVVSLVWSVFGAMLLLTGIRKRQQPLRLGALGLLAVTVVKVFIFDLGYLDGGSRILSLGGLGVSLIFISWLYSRFGSEKRQALQG
jgi:uncharacterized membrane protein